MDSTTEALHSGIEAGVVYKAGTRNVSNFKRIRFAITCTSEYANLLSIYVLSYATPLHGAIFCLEVRMVLRDLLAVCVQFQISPLPVRVRM